MTAVLETAPTDRSGEPTEERYSMARGNGLEDLRTARELADQAREAIRGGRYGEAMAIGSVGVLYLELARLAVEVLAKSSAIPQGSTHARAWQGWQTETGSDLR